MSIFTGSGVAIVTPFLPDGSVNYDKLDELIEYHIDHKTDAIIICGTTGESSTLTEEEHMECIKFTIQQVKRESRSLQERGQMRHLRQSKCQEKRLSTVRMLCFL